MDKEELKNCWSPNPEMQELIGEEHRAGRRECTLRKSNLKVSKGHQRGSPARCL